MTKKTIVVYGSASCGKTLYLKKRAEYLKKQGKKVVVVDRNNASEYFFLELMFW